MLGGGGARPGAPPVAPLRFNTYINIEIIDTIRFQRYGRHGKKEFVASILLIFIYEKLEFFLLKPNLNSFIILNIFRHSIDYQTFCYIFYSLTLRLAFIFFLIDKFIYADYCS